LKSPASDTAGAGRYGYPRRSRGLSRREGDGY